jgi:hypothetical protein
MSDGSCLSQPNMIGLLSGFCESTQPNIICLLNRLIRSCHSLMLMGHVKVEGFNRFNYIGHIRVNTY